MSYDNNKNDIDLRMQGLGYAKSSGIVDYEDAPASEYGNTYILKMTESVRDSAVETLSDRYRDVQIWEITIAFDRTKFSESINKDGLYRARENIIKDLDNPANYGSGVLTRRFHDSDIEETPNYFLLRINLEVLDQVTY